MNGQMFHRLFWGLIIIVLGVGFLLNQLGFIGDMNIGSLFGTYWPVILIIVGVQGLLGGWSHGGGWWGGIPALLGVVFLGRNLGWFAWSVGDIIRVMWPVVLILFGLNMIFRPRRRHGRPDDWSEYPSAPPSQPTRRDASPISQPVPPAPPLHPDPFHPEESATTPPESYGPERAQPHMTREQMRQRHRDYRRELREERIEWWNYSPGVQTRSGFIGDIHLGQDYWELKPLNISHFIGDTVLDLTKAQIPVGETKITISSFIGDVKVFVPNDFEVGVHVISSAFLGDASILDRREGGLFRNMNIETPHYQETDKRIRLVCSTFIGDVRVTKVG